MTPTLKNKSIKVLYLDDEENNLKSFKASFRRDYDVYTALTSEKAFDIVKSVKPQIIFSDQRMPVTSGTEFFNALRQIFPDPIRILITGYTDVEDIIEAINKGHIYRYITKPWSEHEIRVAIENALDLYNTRRRLNQKMSELEKSNHELNRFIYSASHDLRAPVASALGLIRVASHEVEDEKALEYFHKTEASVEKLDVLVSNIIDYYKNSRHEEHLEELQFKEVMAEVIETVKSHQDTHDAQVDCDINQKNSFKADLFRLRIILSHLVSNAIKFKKEDQELARIRIEIESDLEQAVIRVKDSGVGILKEHLQQVFHIFFKGTDQRVGSGLGLYIVKEALEKMGGRIDVDSEPGQGTLFTIEIPNML